MAQRKLIYPADRLFICAVDRSEIDDEYEAGAPNHHWELATHNPPPAGEPAVQLAHRMLYVLRLEVDALGVQYAVQLDKKDPWYAAVVSAALIVVAEERDDWAKTLAETPESP